MMLSWKMAACLAAGNTVVMKPAQVSPLTALKFAELSVKAGIPPGVINIVPGSGKTIRRQNMMRPVWSSLWNAPTYVVARFRGRKRYCHTPPGAEVRVHGEHRDRPDHHEVLRRLQSEEGVPGVGRKVSTRHLRRLRHGPRGAKREYSQSRPDIHFLGGSVRIADLFPLSLTHAWP